MLEPRSCWRGRLLLSDAERVTLAEIGHRLGRKALEEVAAVAKPDTILGWYRKLIANKFDGSKARWNDNDLNQLKSVPGNAFEVVPTGTIHK